MPVLNDAKRERFANLVARGMKIVEAYEKAGYRRNTGNATSLRKREDVSRRIEELQREMQHYNEAELNTFLHDSGITQTYIIRKLIETANEAKDASKFDVAVRAYKDIGMELFGMFTERKHVSIDHNSVHTTTTTTIDFAQIGAALENLAGESPRVLEIEGVADVLDQTGNLTSPLALEHVQH